HLALERIELLLPLDRFRIDARKLQREARFPSARFVVDLIRRDAQVPLAVARIHRHPGFVRRLPVVGAERASCGGQVILERGLILAEGLGGELELTRDRLHLLSIDFRVRNRSKTSRAILVGNDDTEMPHELSRIRLLLKHAAELGVFLYLLWIQAEDALRLLGQRAAFRDVLSFRCLTEWRLIAIEEHLARWVVHGNVGLHPEHAALSRIQPFDELGCSQHVTYESLLAVGDLCQVGQDERGSPLCQLFQDELTSLLLRGIGRHRCRPEHRVVCVAELSREASRLVEPDGPLVASVAVQDLDFVWIDAAVAVGILAPEERQEQLRRAPIEVGAFELAVRPLSLFARFATTRSNRACDNSCQQKRASQARAAHGVLRSRVARRNDATHQGHSAYGSTSIRLCQKSWIRCANRALSMCDPVHRRAPWQPRKQPSITMRSALGSRSRAVVPLM